MSSCLGAAIDDAGAAFATRCDATVATGCNAAAACMAYRSIADELSKPMHISRRWGARARNYARSVARTCARARTHARIRCASRSRARGNWRRSSTRSCRRLSPCTTLSTISSSRSAPPETSDGSSVGHRRRTSWRLGRADAAVSQLGIGRAWIPLSAFGHAWPFLGCGFGGYAICAMHCGCTTALCRWTS
jgi:hypothetical protein